MVIKAMLFKFKMKLQKKKNAWKWYMNMVNTEFYVCMLYSRFAIVLVLISFFIIYIHILPFVLIVFHTESVSCFIINFSSTPSALIYLSWSFLFSLTYPCLLSYNGRAPFCRVLVTVR